MSTQQPFDDRHCPLCGETNACALAQSTALTQSSALAQNTVFQNQETQNPDAESCWCQQATFTDTIRAQAQQKNRALNRPASCICKTCAEKAEQLARSAMSN